MWTKLQHGQKWGDWTLDVRTAKSYTLVLDSPDRKDPDHHHHHHYEIPIDEITRSAQMLDWIFQLRMKTWVTNDIMGDLLSAFQDIFRPQGSLCGGGIDKTLDAEAWLDSRVSKN
jgi:hypothetical protein